MTLFTIGFTKRTAEQFFETLRGAGVRRVLDVRLNNSSQLAGFSKRDDLRYFLRGLGGIDYQHLTEFAPTQEFLDRFKKHGGDWDLYEQQYVGLLRERGCERLYPRELFDGGCLLCSEPTPEHCHRRLAAEYLAAAWNDVRILHL